MSGGARQEFDRACRDQVRELALELLGKPDLRTAEEWRWGRKGSLALVVSGARCGLWFDHESGEGGGISELVARHLRANRQDAVEWIASRIGVAPPTGKAARRKEASRIALQPAPVPPASVDEPRQESPGSDAADRASRIWMTERYLRMANGRTMPLLSEFHTDPVAEAIRWCICEGELIQAIGRGRGVNRTAETPLAIDIFSDAVLPLTINEVAAWPDLRPQRRDLMALEGGILDNAADMAACFPSLWPSADAARQDRQRSVTNCYYKDLYNSRMSHSSAEVTYQPEGPGQRSRTAQFDLGIIRDPRDWLVERLGPLSKCHIVMRDSDADTGVEEFGEEATVLSVDSAASQGAQVNDV